MCYLLLLCFLKEPYFKGLKLIFQCKLYINMAPNLYNTYMHKQIYIYIFRLHLDGQGTEQHVRYRHPGLLPHGVDRLDPRFTFDTMTQVLSSTNPY